MSSMDSLRWHLPAATRCASDGCTSGPKTWPLQYARHQGVLCRLCSSCLLLSNLSLYCCNCFTLLDDSLLSHNDNPHISSRASNVTCLIWHESVTHLSCIHSPGDVFICPPCSAAAVGRPFSYIPSSMAPLDMQGARVILLSTKMALKLLKKEAAKERALGERMVIESLEARKQADHALSMAFTQGCVMGERMVVDPNLPSTSKHISPPENLCPQGGEPHIDMLNIDLNEPPPSSPTTLAVDTKGVQRGVARDSNYDPTLSSMATLTLGKECM